jgi:hypothetical protein
MRNAVRRAGRPIPDGGQPGTESALSACREPEGGPERQRKALPPQQAIVARSVGELGMKL